MISRRTLLEIAAALVVIGWIAYHWHRDSIEQAKNDVRMEMRDHEKQAVDDAVSKALKDRDAANKPLEKAREQVARGHVEQALPQATEGWPVPVIVAGVAPVDLHPGDMVVPAASVPQATDDLLSGKICRNNLAACYVERNGLQQKYDMDEQTIADLKRERKGGPWYKRAARDGLEVGASAGLAYLASGGNKGAAAGAAAGVIGIKLIF